MHASRRIALLAIALGLTALATATAVTTPNCVYECRNTTTGKITLRTESDGSQVGCCTGEGLSCPPGTVYAGSIAWNNQFCAE